MGKTFDVQKKGELSIREFMDGLHGVVGNLDFNAEAKELDIEVLKPRNRASARADAAARGEAKSKRKMPAKGTHGTMSLPLMTGPGSHQQLQRAFVQSALAGALHAATAQ